MSLLESSIRVVDDLPNESDFFDNKSDDKDSGINLRSDSAASLSELNGKLYCSLFVDLNSQLKDVTFQDVVSNLPEDWENLDFHRKKSCILSNIYSTCVNKAINHLEILQNAIDKWYVEASHGFKSVVLMCISFFFLIKGWLKIPDQRIRIHDMRRI